MTDELAAQLAAQLRIAVDALVKIAARDHYHGLGSVNIARTALRTMGLDETGKRRRE